MRITLFSVILLAALSIVLPVYAQELVSISTDKSSYQEGDTIVISGNVAQIIEDSRVSLQIFSGETLTAIDQVIPLSDGTFTKTFQTDGPVWVSGSYMVRAAYSGNIAETYFDFSSVDQIESQTPTAEPSPETPVETPVEPPAETPTSQEVSPPDTIEEVLPIPQMAEIPEWVRGVFVYWAEGNISDQELINAIKFLVNSGIVNLN